MAGLKVSAPDGVKVSRPVLRSWSGKCIPFWQCFEAEKMSRVVGPDSSRLFSIVGS